MQNLPTELESLVERFASDEDALGVIGTILIVLLVLFVLGFFAFNT